MPKMPSMTANAAIGIAVLSSCINDADFFAVVIVIVVATALPDGVTVAGLNVQLAPAGNPEHAKLTAELNPFSGVTVSVNVPCPPETIVKADTDFDNPKLGGGRLMVYVAEATSLVM